MEIIGVMCRGCICRGIIFLCVDIENIVNANFLRILFIVLNLLSNFK